MTNRLYYNDSYQVTFGAAVLSCDPRDGQFEVVLDQTAFYPTSGGQPFDVGSIADALVHDVFDRDDGTVAHLVDREVTVGTTVHAEVDWRRRFDHMQQHTGQHVLSAAFDRLCQARTESFHLGAASATIDLGREVSPSQIAAAVDESNRIVWEDRPVIVRFASAEEARALPLRKESARTGPLRLVEVQDFDLSACGGTHVGRTGAIGIIAVASWEKFRGGTRVEFLCGGRVLARFGEWRDALAATTERLSVPPADLAAAVEKLQHETRALQKTIRAQQERLAGHEAEALVARAQRADDRLIVVDAFEGWDAAGLKALATAAIKIAPSAAIALFSRTEPPIVVIAAGRETPVDASAVLKSITARFGGKGGGKRELAQGGGFSAPVDELLEAARAELQKAES
ncbi:MAG TPA: DHHA1 domain-containing protein [Vicinamibacterales bacterium]|nr:DHHA1 domain-containing protein [Vicinamibacterales bacterium]